MARSFRSKLQRALNVALASLGVQLARRDRVFDMPGVLAHAAQRGFHPGTVIDVGASNGVWSEDAHRYFPQAKYLLFEPLAERHEALRHLRERRGFDFVAAVAGNRRGEIGFSVDAALDGSGVARPGETPSRIVPVTTIDEEVASRNLPAPYCLKLDTHGHELQVLAGADRVLGRTGLLIIEAYNFHLTPGCLRFHELCAWLETRGFRCCDLADPMRRPGDGVLWQMDLAFAPASDPIFASTAYR